MAQTLLPAYLALGEDRAKVAEAEERMRAHADPAFADFNLDELRNPAEVSSEVLRGSLEQLPFGPGPRVVIVHGADRLSAEAAASLVDYLHAPSPTTVLLLTAPKLNKASRLYKAVCGLGQRAVIDCEVEVPRRLPKQVGDWARSAGVRLGPGAAEELAERLGPRAGLIQRTLATLAETHRGAPGTDVLILREVVEREVPRLQNPDAWDFSDAVLDRDPRRALAVLRAAATDVYVPWHAFLVGQLRYVAAASCLSPAALEGALGKKNSWKRQRFQRWASRFSAQELEHALVDAAVVERALKSSANKETAFVAWALSICVPGAPRVGAVLGKERP